MDGRDRTILERLMSDGRATWAELAGEAGLSPPAVAERVRKLEERGVIRGYAARLDPATIGAGTLAFITVGTVGPSAHPELAAWAERTPQVQECHLVTGDYDYLLKVRCASPRALGRFLQEQLRAIEGVVRTVSTIALGTVKETAVVPLPVTEGDPTGATAT